jgi:hypothetical protein
MDSSFIRHVIDTSDERGLTVEEALSHWQMAGGANAGPQSSHWVSIAFGVAKRARENGAHPPKTDQPPQP